MSSSDSDGLTNHHLTAEQMIVDALAILQRGLPSGDLSDRQVISELWGIFDNPLTRPVLERAARKAGRETQ